MRAVSLFATMLFFAFIITGCEKDGTFEPGGSTPTTDLDITVTNSASTPIFGATVGLYPTYADMLQETNLIKAGTTDSYGRVVFKKISSLKYYFLAKKVCNTNLFETINSTSGAIPANTTTYGFATIRPAGSLKFVNTSSDPYQIWINGVYWVNITGGGTLIAPALIGAYSIKVIQISGYILYPTQREYNANVTCGVTIVATFP